MNLKLVKSGIPFFLMLWLAVPALTEEGMYPISELDRLDLKARGLELTAKDLFQVGETCLVDGICRVNGCTGSFVSGNGLIITNHHCAYRAIQTASTAETDYLKDGFLARRPGEEIPAVGYEVRITERFEDVSQAVLEAVTAEMSYAERDKAIAKRRKEIEKRAEAENPGMRAEVAEMFTGRNYMLFLYTFIKDVRLVFAPPSSVGSFGGDIDNWEWPRHTGDFSFMRAYVAPDGSTAEYSPENVPYQPKRFIRVAPKGVSEGDAVFLLGYPGRTSRHKTSAFLKYEANVRLPFVVEQYQWRIDQMLQAGQSDRSIALKHTSTIKSLANVEKRSRGQLKGIRRKQIVERRAEMEANLQSYIDSAPGRKEKYGYVLPQIAEVYEEMTESAGYEMNVGALRSASQRIGLAMTVIEAAHERQKPDLERETAFMDRNIGRTKQRAMLTVRNWHGPTDETITREMFRRLASSDVAKEVDGLSQALANEASLNETVERLYSDNPMWSEAVLAERFQMSVEQLGELDDPTLKLAFQLYPEFVRLRERNKARSGKLGQLYSALIDVKQQFLQTKFVPDANGTLRMTVGTIRGYSPEDAVYKSPITTLQGVLDKTTGEEPFMTPERIVELREQGDFGKFAHAKLNDVPVAILYDTDTTGGNSGSPVINAKGELVGVNFDRAFEATINDFAWDQSYSRSIGVDIRYVLWIAGVVYQADELLREMGVAN